MVTWCPGLNESARWRSYWNRGTWYKPEWWSKATSFSRRSFVRRLGCLRPRWSTQVMKFLFPTANHRAAISKWSYCQSTTASKLLSSRITVPWTRKLELIYLQSALLVSLPIRRVFLSRIRWSPFVRHLCPYRSYKNNINSFARQCSGLIAKQINWRVRFFIPLTGE